MQGISSTCATLCIPYPIEIWHQTNRIGLKPFSRNIFIQMRLVTTFVKTVQHKMRKTIQHKLQVLNTVKKIKYNDK